MNQKPFLSVIVPLYNEEQRIQKVRKILEYVAKKPFAWEVVFIDDGSTDHTAERLKKFKMAHTKILSYKKNKGKGFAIKSGTLAAQGAFRLFMDADLSVDPAQFDTFLPYLRNFDIVIGSRRVKGAHIRTHQPFLREKMGQIFSALTRLWLGISVSDATCGFKCFSQKAANIIFPLQTIDRWGFDSEILFIAKKKRLALIEVPVRWKDDPRSRVRLPQDIFSSFIELTRILYNNFIGKYG